MKVMKRKILSAREQRNSRTSKDVYEESDERDASQIKELQFRGYLVDDSLLFRLCCLRSNNVCVCVCHPQRQCHKGVARRSK